MGAGLVFTLARLVSWKTLMRRAIWFDIAFTLVMPALFAGSYAGMVLAALSGIVFSVILAIFKLFTPRAVYA
jgi:hypothetical protein